MMKSLLLVLIPALILLYGCKSDNKIIDKNIDKNCLSVTDVTTPSICYDAVKGLTLTASNVPQSTTLTWVIAPLKDTINGGTYKPYKVTTNSNSIIIPDSIINGYSSIQVVYVAMNNCGSPLNYKFVRRFINSSSCDEWYFKEKYVGGD